MAETKKRSTTTTKKTTAKKTKEVVPEAVPVEQATPVFTQDEVNAIVAQAVEAALAKQAQQNVIRVSADTPMVKLLYQCECSPVNVINFGVNGKFGSITGKTGKLNITKEAFVGEFRDELVQALLASRELIVIDGLTDEEREMYGVAYKKGEYMDEKVFAKMVDMGNAILDIYPDLNQTYKDMVAKRFAEEYEKNPKRIARDLVVKLNDMSKKSFKDLPKGDLRRKGSFSGVIEKMNEAEVEEE